MAQDQGTVEDKVEDTQIVKSSAPTKTVRQPGFGEGMAEGICITADPLGIVIQSVAHWMGYDRVKTIGGYAFYGNTEEGTHFSPHTFWRALPKLIIPMGVYSQRYMQSPTAVLTMAAVQGATLVADVVANVRVHKHYGTLKGPAQEKPIA